MQALSQNPKRSACVLSHGARECERASEAERETRKAGDRSAGFKLYIFRESVSVWEREGEKSMRMKALCLVLSQWLTKEFLLNELN